MKILKPISIFCFMSISFLIQKVAAHDFHVSIMDIVVNEEEQQLEITLRVFTEDLEAALEQMNGKHLHLGEDELNNPTDAYIYNYVVQYVFFTINNTPVQPDWIGKEVEIEETFIYMVLPLLAKGQSLFVESKLFFELFTDQENRILFEDGNRKQSLVLHAENSKGKLIIN
jgi:Domain of unknown function (DUF6702)